ncbi:FimV/HubP family polar landmark protein [Thiothrix lacustris]|uniref:FimV/HubP family polar landmark protein n=1 Tax=Thiothrix lacustris TaxID=525917 RepID=UPI0027E580B9|nr:FimV/HubP family polar landmark protein [Thiothrix lacustris]WMP15679.1 FimV/HubP family polar landmark protein [Thiothrix lacustris]
MKKLTQFSQPLRASLPRVLTLAALIGTCLSDVVLAEDKVWEVQSGNVLSKIVAEHYPDYADRQAIMDEILKRNPKAFSNKSVNSLIVGKTLILPDAKDLPNLQPSPPPPAPAQPAKLGADSAALAELKDTVALLQEENAALQEMVKGYVEAPTTNTNVVDDLKKQLDAAKQSLKESETIKQQLEEQVSTAKHDNETLQNDLQQIRAAAAMAENNAVSAGNLPWILLGLLALLTLPLIWLLRRKREPTPLVSSAVSSSTVATTPTAAVNTSSLPSEVTQDSPKMQAATTATTAAVVVVDSNPDAALKLDIARAYLDLRDSAAAADMLQEVLKEGGEQQRQEAREILSFIT